MPGYRDAPLIDADADATLDVDDFIFVSGLASAGQAAATSGGDDLPPDTGFPNGRRSGDDAGDIYVFDGGPAKAAAGSTAAAMQTGDGGGAPDGPADAGTMPVDMAGFLLV